MATRNHPRKRANLVVKEEGAHVIAQAMVAAFQGLAAASGAAPVGDLTPAEFGRLIIEQAKAGGPSGTTPSACARKLQAAGYTTVNRIPISVKGVRQMACKLERDGEAFVDRGGAGDMSIRSTT